MIIDCRALKIYLRGDMLMHHSGGTRVRSNTDHMGGSRLACARYTQDPIREASTFVDASGSAGVLSRGVGLRGFESHPPHHRTVMRLYKIGKLCRMRLVLLGSFFPQVLRSFTVVNPSLLE